MLANVPLQFQEAPIEYTVIRNSAKDLLGFSTKDDTKLITRNDDGTSISKEVPLIITRCHSEFMGYTGSKAIGWLKTRDGRCVTVNLDSGEINVTGCSTADDKTQLSQFWQAAPDGSLAFLGYKAGDPEVIWRFNVHQDDAEGPIYATTQEGTITLAFKTTA